MATGMLNGTSIKSIEILRGSELEADWFKRDLQGANAAVSIPNLFTMEVADVLKVALLPPPSEVKILDYVYTPYPVTHSAPTTSISGSSVEVPDDFTPFVKYGVLADLFGKTGEAHDPQRSQICQQLFELGIEVARMINNANNQ
jgi:hypothetical protein